MSFLTLQASEEDIANIFRFAFAVDHFHLGKGKRANYKGEYLQKVDLVRQVKERVVTGKDITLLTEKRKPWLVDVTE